jgi:REP element-mobilizing transposase RayT
MPGRDLFADDADRRHYLEELAGAASASSWQVLGFCLMTNHVHVLVRTPQPNLGAGMKQAQERQAMRLNRRLRAQGHVFRGRFKNRLVLTDRHAVGCLRYIARNPVEAHMCPSAAAWAWSSHRALAGYERAPAWLDVRAALAFFGDDGPDARRAYLRAVAMTDDALVRELQRDHSDAWLVDAVDAFHLDVPVIARALDVGTSTVYRRIAAARAENEGTVP